MQLILGLNTYFSKSNLINSVTLAVNRPAQPPKTEHPSLRMLRLDQPDTLSASLAC